MATQEEKDNCVLWYHESKSVTAVQRRFRKEFGLNPLIRASSLYGRFFFAEQTITGTVYRDMMEVWLMPQLEKNCGNAFFFQHGCALSHFHRNVTQFLNNRFPGRWISRGGPTM
jgi:hypothetical protein